jgi:hypothetical protein
MAHFLVIRCESSSDAFRLLGEAAIDAAFTTLRAFSAGDGTGTKMRACAESVPDPDVLLAETEGTPVTREMSDKVYEHHRRLSETYPVHVVTG